MPCYRQLSDATNGQILFFSAEHARGITELLVQGAISIPAAEKTETHIGRGFWLLAIPFAQRLPPIQCPGYKVHTHTAAGRTQPNIRTFGDP
jgi:hypothetical protein